MAEKQLGSQTIFFETPPRVAGYAAVTGKKEGEGPLGNRFDLTVNDPFFGEKTWEKAEMRMQQETFSRAIKKAGLSKEDISAAFGGDLLNQCIATGYAAREAKIPFVGLYGACSTMAEGTLLAAMAIDGGFAEHALAITSSHFCTAERQYRTPLEYGGQRTPTAQWTATASGALVLSRGESGKKGPRVTHALIGRVVDMGITDVNNMGAAMAAAAYESLKTFFAESGLPPESFRHIVTGDLGRVGADMVRRMFEEDGHPLPRCYEDCGVLLYDAKQQDVHAGGSGCGCSAAVLCGHLLGELQTEERLLFAGTGAMHSPVSCCQGESVPGICHIVVFEG